MAYSQPGMKFLFLAVFQGIACAALAQQRPEGGVAAAADNLRSCALAVAGGMPRDQKSQALAGEIQANATGLADGLRGNPAVPAEYLANLNELVGICRSMLMSLTPDAPLGGGRSSGNMEAVARDIAVKSGDVSGQRTGRLIPIEARTFKAGQPDNGWIVYYQWMPASPGKDIKLAAPTPGATGSVAPGIYSFHAEKIVGGRKVVSQAKIMPVGGYPKVQIAITVP